MLLNSPPTITFVQRSISDESDDEIEEEKHTIVSSTSADEMEYLLRMVFKRPMSSTFRLWIDTKTSGDVNFTLRQLAEEFHRIAKEDKGKEINRLHLTLWECVVDEVRVEWANERTKAMQSPSIITFLTPNFTPTGRKLCSCFSSSPTFTSAAALETALLGSFIHIGKMGPITRIWITTKDGRKIDVTLTELAEQVSRTSKDGLRVVDASGLWGFGVYEVWLS